MRRRETEQERRATREMELNVHPSRYGLGRAHYVSSHLENVELNAAGVKH